MCTIKSLTILSLVLTGCTVAAPNPPTAETPPEETETPPSPLPPTPPPPPQIDDPEPGSALLLSPRHGQVIGGLTSTVPLSFAGRTPAGGETVSVQVLSNPLDMSTWVTVAETVAGTESNGNPELGYSWNASVSPAQRGLNSWPQGGLFRVRVLVNGIPSAVLSHDADGCIAQNQTVEGSRELACAAKKANGIVLVSPAQARLAPGQLEVPLPAFPQYLARKGLGSEQATELYYQQTEAPATYDEFMARYMNNATLKSRAVYYNHGDLATGRNIECGEFDDGVVNGVVQKGVVCATGNYGEFSGDPGVGMNEALIGIDSPDGEGGAFAYVMMVYRPSKGEENAVSFVVYGPDGQRLNAASLDTRNELNPDLPNALLSVDTIPSTCINCHGSGATFDSLTGIVTGASFLPLDALQMTFTDNDPQYSYAAQSESIRQINALVNKTNLNETTKSIVEELYPGGVDVPGSLMYKSDTPASWSVSARSSETYRHAIAPSCRGCHMTGTIDFSTEEKFRLTGQTAIENVCGNFSMPNAEVVVDNFWKGPGRAYLVDFFDIANPCPPPANIP